MASKLKTMKGATAGSITLRLFRDLPPAQVGWLAAAWARYTDGGEEPEDVPPEYLGAWLAVKEEADRIEELHKIRSEVGKKGNEERWGDKGESQSIANGRKASQTVANGRKRSQGIAEERRGEENNICNTSEKRDVCDSPCADARETAAGDNAPAPPITHTKVSYPVELEVELRGGPLSAQEAAEYAAGPECGLTEDQLIAWANHNASRGWVNKNGFLMGKREAKASMRGWRANAPHFSALRKAELKRAEGRGDGDVTIRGVRVANKGDDLGDWGK